MIKKAVLFVAGKFFSIWLRLPKKFRERVGRARNTVRRYIIRALDLILPPFIEFHIVPHAVWTALDKTGSKPLRTKYINALEENVILRQRLGFKVFMGQGE